MQRETRVLHQRLEADLGLLEPGLTLHRYGRVLRAFHGYYVPVEAALVRLAPALGFPLRARSPLIESDLLALGLSRHEIAALPRCTELPRLAVAADLMGCLYVLEGACLGGQVISRALRQRFGLGRDNGLAFFIGDAGATGARWRFVLAWLDGRRGARIDEIVASACATFQTLARWLAQQGAMRWSI